MGDTTVICSEFSKKKNTKEWWTEWKKLIFTAKTTFIKTLSNTHTHIQKSFIYFAFYIIHFLSVLWHHGMKYDKHTKKSMAIISDYYKAVNCTSLPYLHLLFFCESLILMCLHACVRTMELCSKFKSNDDCVCPLNWNVINDK